MNRGPNQTSRFTSKIRYDVAVTPGEYLQILREGLLAWNDWRLRHPYSKVDLTGCDLRSFELSRTFSDPAADREQTIPLFTRGIDLSSATLASANFAHADLGSANFTRADLGGANFAGAELWGVNFEGADLRLADFTAAKFADVTWGNCDLRGAVGLNFASHAFLSSIDIRSIRRADIPKSFLAGCGLPPDLVDYLPSILDGVAIAKYSCFISYCAADEKFVRRLHGDLESAKIRSWFAPVNMRAGDLIRQRLDEAVALSEKLVVVLSSASIASQYVEQEVEAAIEKERQQKRLVLIPIMVDRAVFNASSGWPAFVRRTRHIADFSNWNSWSRYRSALERLIADVKKTALSALVRRDPTAG